MAEKKSLLSKVRAAVKKVTTKPQVKKTAVKSKVTTKPQVKKTAVKSKVTTKPQVKKTAVKSVSGLRKFKSYTSKSNEKYMSKSQITHFKKILNDWKVELSTELSRTVSHMQTDVTTYADPNDRASQESEMALELRNRDRERKLIKKINETIKNIDEDEYGYCTGCGEEIGLNRLQARPTATLCIDCKTLQEIKEKQMAK